MTIPHQASLAANASGAASWDSCINHVTYNAAWNTYHVSQHASGTFNLFFYVAPR